VADVDEFKRDALSQSVERCLELVLFLQSAGEWVTTADIYSAVVGYAEIQTETSRRKQFDRDRDYLLNAGIKVEKAVDPNMDQRVSWRLAPDNFTSEQTISLDGFTAVELAALSTSVASTVLSDAPRAADRFDSAVIDGSQPLRQVADVIPTISQSTPALTEFVAGAVASRKRLRFSYNGSMRQVEPYRVNLRNGRWYLRAADSESQVLVTFRVDRIEPYPKIALGAAFVRDSTVAAKAAAELELDPLQFRQNDPIKVTATFDVTGAGAAEQLSEAFDATPVVEGDRTTVSAVISNHVAAYALLLPVLTHVVSLEPKSFVEGMRERLGQLTHEAKQFGQGRAND
jgi:predicted DNA-binding transcriptional regulator YafY